MSATGQADTLAPQLHTGVVTLGISLSEAQEAKLLAYLRLMEKWNRTHNLTAIREPERMVSAHLLDSLAVIPALPLPRGSGVIDVGTGGGLPGMALAIARPDLRVTLLDSNQKKTAFLRQAAGELGIANVTVVAARAEEHRPPQGYDLVICRAFSELAEFARLAGHMVADGTNGGGWLVAMKGVHPDEELTKLGGAWRVDRVVKLAVPGLDAERHLVLMQRDTGNVQGNTQP